MVRSSIVTVSVRNSIVSIQITRCIITVISITTRSITGWLLIRYFNLSVLVQRFSPNAKLAKSLKDFIYLFINVYHISKESCVLLYDACGYAALTQSILGQSQQWHGQCEKLHRQQTKNEGQHNRNKHNHEIEHLYDNEY